MARRSSGSTGRPPARSSGGVRAAKVGVGAAGLGFGAYGVGKTLKYLRRVKPYMN